MGVPLADVLRHLRLLVGWSSTAGQTDGQLLERFIGRKEEAAFEQLLARHGPMVLGVCRQLLREPEDAEDAFQATFLVLVRRAASIGKRDQLAGWLHGVAHRVAARARAQGARLGQRERQGVEVVAAEPSFQTAWDDRQPVIQEEINRLPDKYRLPVVLCYLEGKTREEAARDLGWTPSAVKGRLERAREQLRKRLTRRGVALSAGALTAIISPQATALPPALVGGTLGAATLLVGGKSVAAGAVSPQVLSLTDGVIRTMFLAKLKVSAAVLFVFGIVGAGLAVSVYRSSAAEHGGEERAVNPIDPAPNSDQPARDPAAAPQEPGLPKVQVTYPISRMVVDHQDYTGRTEATTVQITPGATGEIIQIKFAAGSTVKKGDLLFEIDPRAYQAELDKARAEFDRAQARFKLARQNAETQKKLWAMRSTSEEDLARAVLDSEEALASRQAAKPSLELAQLHLQSTRVVAPIDGRIGQALVAPGSYVKEGTTVLATIVAASPMYVNFDMDEATFLRLRRESMREKFKPLGGSVDVQLVDEKSFSRRAAIDFVGNQVDANTGTVRVRAVLSNADQFLLPGLFVRIRLPVSEPYQALLVPAQAILNDQGQKCLMVVNRQGVLERRHVELGSLQDHWEAVKGGLTKDDRVVVKGQTSLRPGTKIQIEPANPSPPPPMQDEQPQPAPPAPGATRQ
jgi:RND family efflux transporter MFP subunit